MAECCRSAPGQRPVDSLSSDRDVYKSPGRVVTPETFGIQPQQINLPPPSCLHFRSCRGQFRAIPQNRFGKTVCSVLKWYGLIRADHTMYEIGSCLR